MFYFTFSQGIAQCQAVHNILSNNVHRIRFDGQALALFKDQQSILVVWGNKPNTKKAKFLARKASIPCWQLEDGFIAYQGHPALGDERFSLIVDKTGIYYDATTPSDLESLLMTPERWLTDSLIQRSKAIILLMRKHYLSKYNHEPTTTSICFDDDTSKVLVVDQTFGDCSVTYGMAGEMSFSSMLTAALEENPTAEIWVKVHPDAVLGKKKSYLKAKLYSDPRIKVLAEAVNAQSILKFFQKVYVVTSQLGFEALLHNKPVICFGVPFYSGWGLTDDRVPCPRRTIKHTIESLFAASCLKYTRYINPETGQRCELEDVLPLLIRQRRYQQQQVNNLYAVGFSLWKRAFIYYFVGAEVKQLVYVSSLKSAKKRLRSGDGLLIWGRKFDEAPELASLNCPVWRVEDGFIRSNGLGVELRRPSSLVIDKTGMYYDATRPSDLERLLSTYRLTHDDRHIAARLMREIRKNRISKYNLVESPRHISDSFPDNKKIILVPGQVQSDASLRFGCIDLYTNAALLKAVREANPEAWIVYKPHPDVVARQRDGGMSVSEASKLADCVITEGDIFSCIEQANEVHVLTSLTGFEALLQGKTVVTYGMPFYAGWGLTNDRHQCHRRTRRLTLSELVYISLERYPRYVHWSTRRFTTALNTVSTLASSRDSRPPVKGIRSWCGRKLRKVNFLWEAILKR